MIMLRSSALILITAAAALALFAPAGSAADSTQAGCHLAGTATVTPGLTTTEQNIEFGFTGDLTDCQGAKGIDSGTISANGKGTGSCSANTTKGIAKAAWSNGKKSKIKFKTSGTGVYVTVTGKVVKGKFKGDAVNAQLVFQTDHPEDCAGSGVSDPTFDGLATISG
jgi:hypothetical protein